jgi:hypothetical protein
VIAPWRPVPLTPAEERALGALRDEHRRSPAALDRALGLRADALLTRAMAPHVQAIVDRDGLPHTCHVLNGWGAGRLGGRPLIDRVLPFVQRAPGGAPFVLQCNSEGEFHPWQTLAYAVMAGVDPDRPLADTDVTLRRLARNSRTVPLPDGEELGHLLYALAHLDPGLEHGPFTVAGERCGARELVARALQAHRYGDFKVCRKFHLTEGLCAAAALMPEAADCRGEAEVFLEGQAELAGLLALTLRACDEPASGPLERAEALALRDRMGLGSLVENHFYQAGHLVELACLVDALGFSLPAVTWSLIHEVCDRLNALLPRWLPRVCFPHCFFHFGHYRRALTLLLRRDAGLPQDLAAFAVDFDALPAPAEAPAAAASEAPPGAPPGASLYTAAPPPEPARPYFQAVIDAYAALAGEGLRPRGGFPHFRRVGPRAWPRALHYELLDYGEAVGAEIHLESDAVLPARDALRSLEPAVAGRFPGLPVLWDPGWYRGRGRLAVGFPPQAAPEEVARGLAALIALTLPSLDPLARRLTVTAPERWHHTHRRG